MALTLSQIREKLQAKDNTSNGSKKTSFGDNANYPHWNIEEGDTARLRFLPDGNSNNPFFWAEKAMIKLEFNGILGQADSKKTIVQIPCIEMYPGYENKCPILAEVRLWFKDKDMEELGRKYWKKKSYIFQGFVRENPLKDQVTPENPIRRFTISPQIFNLITAVLKDPELENMPTDYEHGLDFSVLKATKGGFADYSTSKWARRDSPLTADEVAAIEKYGLFNLTDFLPKMPSAEDQVIMKEMFEASVNGEAYDPVRWGKHFKPAGFQNANDTTDSTSTAPAAVAPAVKTTPAPVVKATSAPVAEDDMPFDNAEPIKAEPKAATGSRAEDILQLIRNRQKTTA